MTYEEEKIRDAIKIAFNTGRLFERDKTYFEATANENDLVQEIFERNVINNKEKDKK